MSSDHLWDETDLFRWVRDPYLRAFNRIQFMVGHLSGYPRLQRIYWASIDPRDRQHIDQLVDLANDLGPHRVRVLVSQNINGQ